MSRVVVNSTQHGSIKQVVGLESKMTIAFLYLVSDFCSDWLEMSDNINGIQIENSSFFPSVPSFH